MLKAKFHFDSFDKYESCSTLLFAEYYYCDCDRDDTELFNTVTD